MNYCQFRNDFIKRMANAGGGGGLLPPEYQQVEYLYSSNKPYIDTGIIIPDNYEKISVRIESLSAEGRYFGTWRVDGYASIIPYKGTGPFDKIFIGGSDLTVATTQINTVYDMDLTADSGALSGTYCGASVNRQYSGVVKSDKTELLFRGSTGSYARIYYFKLYTSAGLVRDFIPCYRKSDNVPGMYDLVTSTFFTNAGSGEFTVGNDVV